MATIDSTTSGQWGQYNLRDGSQGPWWLSQDMWNVGGLPLDGVTVDQTISGNPAAGPNGTTFTWKYPDVLAQWGVYAYPDIVYGDGGYNTLPANHLTPLRIGDIRSLSVTFDISTVAAYDTYDCLLEAWPDSVANSTNSGQTLQAEVGVFAHVGTHYMYDYILSQHPFSFSAGGFNCLIAVRSGTVNSGSPPFIQILPVTTPGGTTALDMVNSGSHTIPLDAIYAELVRRGLLDPNSYLNGYQCGFEIGQGSGSATINSLSYDWNSASSTAAPAIPVIASFSPDSNIVGDGITSAKILTLTGTADANSTVNVFDGTTRLGTATVNASGAWSYTTSTLADGLHSFTATDTNAAATSAASSVLHLTVDSQAPTPRIVNFIDNSNGTVTLSGTSEAGSSLSIYDGTNTTPLGTVTTAANGTWNFTTSVLTGNHSFRARAVDVAGNVGSSIGGIHYGSPINTPTVGSGIVGGIAAHTHRTQGFNGQGHAHLLQNAQQLAPWETTDTSIIGNDAIGTLGLSSAIAGNGNFNLHNSTDQLLQNGQPFANSLLPAWHHDHR